LGSVRSPLKGEAADGSAASPGPGRRTGRGPQLKEPPEKPGRFTEGAVAAFLYDLVDSSSDPNSISNQAGSTDDSIAYPGSYIASVIDNCSLTKSGGGTITVLSGIDQFVYCAERSLDSQSLTNPATGSAYFVVRSQEYQGETYSAVSGPSNTPTGWSSSNIQQMWKYDLFKHGSLP